MYAIVEIAGQQFKVAKDQKVYVHRLQEDEGKKVTFDSVLLIEDGSDITIGAPAIDGAAVEAKVVQHLKGDKVIVFKKKRRKGYRKKNGHRQYLTELVINSIIATGAKKAVKKEEPKKTAPIAADKAKTKDAPVDVSVASKPKVEREAVKKTISKEADDAAKKPTAETGKAKKEVEVSENLVTRAEHRAEEQNIEVNVDKLLHSIGTATKAEADDLKEINGIGPVYEKKLNNIGIYTYAQISKLKAADKDELSALEGITREKIEAEEWVKQAKDLLNKK